MKTLVVSVAVLALSLPIMAVAQDTTKQNDNQNRSAEPGQCQE